MIRGDGILSWSASSSSLAYQGLGGGTGRSKASGSIDDMTQAESDIWSVVIGSGLFIRGYLAIGGSDLHRIQGMCFFSNTQEAALYVEAG